MNTEVLGDLQGKTPAAVYLFLVNATQSQHGSLLLQPKSCQMEPCLHASPLSWLYSRSCQFGITAFEDRWWTRDQRIFRRHQTPAGISSSTLTFFFFLSSPAQTHQLPDLHLFSPPLSSPRRGLLGKGTSPPAGALARRARCASSLSTSSRGTWRRGRSTTAAVSGSSQD